MRFFPDNTQGWSMTQFSRRALLAAVGGTGALVAGCMQRGTDPDRDGDEVTGSDGGTEQDDNETGATDDPGNSDGPVEDDDPIESALPDERFPEECSAYERVERVVCYDAIDPDGVAVYLEPAAESVAEGAGERIDFTLSNDNDRTLATNFYNWHVHKHVDGEWYHVAPRMWNQPLMFVPPGDAHTWTVSVDNAGIEAGESVPWASATESVTLQGVGGGHYGFRARGWFEDEGHEEAIAFAATFEIETDPLELTPTTAIEETEWLEDWLVAHSSRGDPDDDRYRRGAYELERLDDPAAWDGPDDSDDPSEPRQVIVEQVVREDQLRDAIALSNAHDADRVRLVEYTATTPIFGSRTDGVYELQGRYYGVRTRELDAENG